MKTVLKSQSGMTLLELMFALGIVAMSLAMIFGSLISVMIMGRVSESKTEAAAVLSSIMEELQAQSFETLVKYTPPAMHGPGVKYDVAIACVISPPGGSLIDEATGEILPGVLLPLPLPSTFTGVLPNPLEVRAEITWQEDSGHVFKSTASTLVGR